MMIKGSHDSRAEPEKAIPPTEDHGRHGKSVTFTFLTIPGLFLRIHPHNAPDSHYTSIGMGVKTLLITPTLCHLETKRV